MEISNPPQEVSQAGDLGQEGNTVFSERLDLYNVPKCYHLEDDEESKWQQDSKYAMHLNLNLRLGFYLQSFYVCFQKDKPGNPCLSYFDNFQPMGGKVNAGQMHLPGRRGHVSPKHRTSGSNTRKHFILSQRGDCTSSTSGPQCLLGSWEADLKLRNQDITNEIPQMHA